MAIGRAHARLTRVGKAADLSNLAQSLERGGDVLHPRQIGRRIDLQSRSRDSHNKRINERILKIGAQHIACRFGGTTVDSAGAADGNLWQLVGSQGTYNDRDRPESDHSARMCRNPGTELVKTRIHTLALYFILMTKHN